VPRFADRHKYPPRQAGRVPRAGFPPFRGTSSAGYVIDHTHVRLLIRDFRHEAGAGVSETDSELVLAAGAGHRLLDIALRVGLPVRQDIVARNLFNGFGDRRPASGAYKLERWFLRRHGLPSVLIRR
jgi:hypothetical protein